MASISKTDLQIAGVRRGHLLPHRLLSQQEGLYTKLRTKHTLGSGDIRSSGAVAAEDTQVHEELDQPLQLAEFSGNSPMDNLQATCLMQARDAAIRLAAVERARANSLRENYAPLERRLEAVRGIEMVLAQLRPLCDAPAAEEAFTYFSGEGFARSLAGLGDFPTGAAAQKRFIEDAGSLLQRGLLPLQSSRMETLTEIQDAVSRLPAEGTLTESAAVALARLGSFCSQMVDNAALAAERLQLAELRIGKLERDVADERAKAARWQGAAARAKAAAVPQAGAARPAADSALESTLRAEIDELRSQVAAARERMSQMAAEEADKTRQAAEAREALEHQVSELQRQLQGNEHSSQILTPLSAVPRQMDELREEAHGLLGTLARVCGDCEISRDSAVKGVMDQLHKAEAELAASREQLRVQKELLEEQRSSALETLRGSLAAHPQQDLAMVVDELAVELDRVQGETASIRASVAPPLVSDAGGIVVNTIDTESIKTALISLEQRASRINAEISRAVSTAVDSARLQVCEAELTELRASVASLEDKTRRQQEALDTCRERDRQLQQILVEEQHKYQVLFERRCDPNGNIESMERELHNYEKIALDLKRQQLCPLCQQNRRDICLRCGHTLCRECFAEQLRKERNRNCPFCQLHTGLNNAEDAQAIVFQLKE